MSTKVVYLSKTLIFLLIAIFIYNDEGYAQKMVTWFELDLIAELNEIYAYERASFTVKARNFGDKVRNVYISLSDPENNYSEVIGGTKWMITVAPGETKEFNFSVTQKYLTPYLLVVLKYNFTRFAREGINAVAKIKILDAEKLLKALKEKNAKSGGLGSDNVILISDTVVIKRFYLQPLDSLPVIYDPSPSDED